jgi:hypothetical protein
MVVGLVLVRGYVRICRHHRHYNFPEDRILVIRLCGFKNGWWTYYMARVLCLSERDGLAEKIRNGGGNTVYIGWRTAMREWWCHGLVVERNPHCLCVMAVHLVLLLLLQWWRWRWRRVVVCLIVWGLLVLSTAVHYMSRMIMRCMYSSVHHQSTNSIQ